MRNEISPERKLPTITSTGEGDQLEPSSIAPTGSSCGAPSSLSRKMAVTTRAPGRDPGRAKNRTVGRARFTHIGGVVADAPGGRDSARDPGRYGSLSSTTVAPRSSVQPSDPASRLPFG